MLGDSTKPGLSSKIQSTSKADRPTKKVGWERRYLRSPTYGKGELPRRISSPDRRRELAATQSRGNGQQEPGTAGRRNNVAPELSSGRSKSHRSVRRCSLPRRNMATCEKITSPAAETGSFQAWRERKDA